MAIYCSKCGTELPDGAAFCDNCGQSMQIAGRVNIPEIKNPFKNPFGKKDIKVDAAPASDNQASKSPAPEVPDSQASKSPAPEVPDSQASRSPAPEVPDSQGSKSPAPEVTYSASNNTPSPEGVKEEAPQNTAPTPQTTYTYASNQPPEENPYLSQKPKKKVPVLPIVIAAAAVAVIGIGVAAFFVIKNKPGDVKVDNKTDDNAVTETTEKKKSGLGLFSSGVDVTETDGSKVKWENRDEATMETVNPATEDDPLPEDYMVGTWLKCYENVADDPNMNRELSDNPSDWRTNMRQRITFSKDGTYIGELWYIDKPDAKATYSGKYYYVDDNNYEDNKLTTYTIMLWTEIDEYHCNPGAPEINEERLKSAFYQTGLAKDSHLENELLLDSGGEWIADGDPGQYLRKITNEYHPELFNTTDLEANALSEIEKYKHGSDDELTLVKNEESEEAEKAQSDSTAAITFGTTDEGTADNGNTDNENTENENTSGGITFGEPEEEKSQTDAGNTPGSTDSATDASSIETKEDTLQSAISFGDSTNNTNDNSVAVGSETADTTTSGSTSSDATLSGSASSEITSSGPVSSDVTPSGPAGSDSTIAGSASGPGADKKAAPSDDGSSANSPAGDDTPVNKAVTGGKFDVLQSGETVYYLMNGQEAQNVWVREADKYYYIGFDKCLMYNNYASDGYYVGADGSWDKYIPRLTTTDSLLTGTYVYENGNDNVTWTFTMTTSGTYDGTAVRTYSFGYSENYGVSYKGGSCYMLEGNGIYGSGPQITVLDQGERFIITDYGYSERFTFKR